MLLSFQDFKKVENTSIRPNASSDQLNWLLIAAAAVVAYFFLFVLKVFFFFRSWSN